jgi:hypothetical protein
MSDKKVYHLENGLVVNSTSDPSTPQFYVDVLLTHNFLDAFGAVPEVVDIPLVGLILEFLSSTTTNIVQGVYDSTTGSPGLWTDSASNIALAINGILCTTNETYLTPYYKNGYLFYPLFVSGLYYQSYKHTITGSVSSGLFLNNDSRSIVFLFDTSVYEFSVNIGGVNVYIVRNISTSIFNIKVSVPAKNTAVSNGVYYPAGSLAITSSFAPFKGVSIVSIRINNEGSSNITIDLNTLNLSSDWEYSYSYEDIPSHDLGIDFSYYASDVSVRVTPYETSFLIGDIFAYNRLLSDNECSSLYNYLKSKFSI